MQTEYFTVPFGASLQTHISYFFSDTFKSSTDAGRSARQAGPIVDALPYDVVMLVHPVTRFLLAWEGTLCWPSVLNPLVHIFIARGAPHPLDWLDIRCLPDIFLA
jgi:hypothetical protein